MSSPVEKGVTDLEKQDGRTTEVVRKEISDGIENMITMSVAPGPGSAAARARQQSELVVGFDRMIRQSCENQGALHGLDTNKLAASVAAMVEQATARAGTRSDIIKELARGSVALSKTSKQLSVDKAMWKKLACRTFVMLVITTFTIFGLMIWALELSKEVKVEGGYLTAADGTPLLVQTDRPAGSLGEIFDLPADQLGTISRIHFVANFFHYYLDIMSIVKNPLLGDVEMHAADGSLLLFRHKVRGANFERHLLFVPTNSDEEIEVPLELVSAVGRRLRVLTDDAQGGYDARGDTVAGAPTPLAMVVVQQDTRPAARRLSEDGDEHVELFTCCDVFEPGPGMCMQACYMDTCATLFTLVEHGDAYKIKSLCEDDEEGAELFSELRDKFPNVPADRLGLWLAGSSDAPEVVYDKNDAAIVTMNEDGSTSWGARRLSEGADSVAMSTIAVVKQPNPDTGRRLGPNDTGRRLGAWTRFQAWASGTKWCGGGTAMDTACPTASNSDDVTADYACRRHDHGARWSSVGIGVKLSCDVDEDLHNAGGHNFMVAGIFGRRGLACVWGCYDYGHFSCFKWHSKWWGGYLTYSSSCGPGEHAHYGWGRFGAYEYDYGYITPLESCSGDLPMSPVGPNGNCPSAVSNCPSK